MKTSTGLEPTKTWTRIQWPYNSEAPFNAWECWQLGNFILHPGQWPERGWSYVASFGANSDRSHSGFLPGCISIESAKAEIKRRISLLSA